VISLQNSIVKHLSKTNTSLSETLSNNPSELMDSSNSSHNDCQHTQTVYSNNALIGSNTHFSACGTNNSGSHISVKKPTASVTPVVKHDINSNSKSCDIVAMETDSKVNHNNHIVCDKTNSVEETDKLNHMVNGFDEDSKNGSRSVSPMETESLENCKNVPNDFHSKHLLNSAKKNTALLVNNEHCIKTDCISLPGSGLDKTEEACLSVNRETDNIKPIVESVINNVTIQNKNNLLLQDNCSSNQGNEENRSSECNDMEVIESSVKKGKTKTNSELVSSNESHKSAIVDLTTLQSYVDQNEG
jgi:hypothetical protein